ncbi:uncharacterized protein [Prorops nasuta]|uniref:uncharacterized protein n=1 Tax=Prorops nasuta TaxID=863751 RepID=UPI0034CE7F3F
MASTLATMSRIPNLQPLVMSAIVRVLTNHGKYIYGRAILDTCATAHFVTDDFASRLSLLMRQCTLSISAINSMNTKSRHSVTITFKSTHSEFQKTLTFLTIPCIAEKLPAETFPRHLVSIPSNIRLADPQFHIPRSVDLLIGSGTTLSLLSVGQINLSTNFSDLYLQKTQLGWTISGGMSVNKPAKYAVCNLIDLAKQISQFWRIEEIDDKEKSQSSEEIECEQHYIKNVKRDINGRYSVRLPFRDNIRKDFSESRTVALLRLYALERKLNANPTLKQEYSSIIQEYLELGHMSEVCEESNDSYYMPHHAIFKPSSVTTKVRIVFDASARGCSGVSLNTTLMVGPTIQDTIFEHLIRFRHHKYVLTADIKQMYRQVMIHKEDRQFQRILWRINNEIKAFELNTVTFGVSAAPFLAIRTIHQLADDESENFPVAAGILKRDLYVDDLLTGADTMEALYSVRNEVIEVFSRGGFDIRQWASNEEKALKDLVDKSVHAEFVIDKGSILKTLGISWDAKKDVILYKVNPVRLSDKITKRNIISEIARIYDPLGLLGPVILYAKVIMQMTWKYKISWDESVPGELHTKWSSFAKQLESLNNISFERRLLIDDAVDIQVHGFCDASKMGYGACLYIRSCNRDGVIRCRLLCAKSRVAPIKEITIPRAELCGALLLANLYDEAIRVFLFTPNSIHFWTDSNIVLCWLHTLPESLKLFVANRVTKIQKLVNVNSWRHVSSGNNPADALSRGQTPNEFIHNDKWFLGPSFLQEQESSWPLQSAQIERYNKRQISKLNTILDVEVPDLRQASCLAVHAVYPEFLLKFSSYNKLIRIIAYCLRFRTACKFKGSLAIEELLEAETRILKIIQTLQFKLEIQELKKSNSNITGKLAFFNPFLDKDGVLHVGGRLKRADIQYLSKHPILLPTHNYITDLIIRKVHFDNHHAGIQTTLSALRQKYWIFDGRNQVRRVIRKCVVCFRFAVKSVNYKMSDLPRCRVQGSRPFYNTGIDFCGPFYIKERKFRNRGKVKVYISVFICMVTRAVHLEIVSEMTTEAFLAAMRRFIARRGSPVNVYTDNGTNFVGANNELQELYALLDTNTFKDKTHEFANSKNLRWHFNVPLSPHFGGIWEAAVKIFKHHFKRVIGAQLYTFEELNTLTIEIEAVLNSRPMCTISSDPNDPMALTPAHFLIGHPFNMLPEENLTTIPQNRLSSWRLIQQARQHFWSRWYLEYLHELQKRQKWTSTEPNLKVYTIVLIKDKGMPCMSWNLGRVIETHSGDDGIVRSATVKTANSTVKRCVGEAVLSKDLN